MHYCGGAVFVYHCIFIAAEVVGIGRGRGSGGSAAAVVGGRRRRRRRKRRAQPDLEAISAHDVLGSEIGDVVETDEVIVGFLRRRWEVREREAEVELTVPGGEEGLGAGEEDGVGGEDRCEAGDGAGGEEAVAFVGDRGEAVGWGWGFGDGLGMGIGVGNGREVGER